MSANVKKWVNRGGLIGMVVGVVLIVVAGGDPAAAIDTVGIVAAIAGSVLVLLREIFN